MNLTTVEQGGLKSSVAGLLFLLKLFEFTAGDIAPGL